MEYLIGAVLAAATCVFFGMLAGFDSERVFYPMMLAPIATYYILFAAMASSTPVLAIESLVASIFLIVAVVGFKKNLWLVAAALAGCLQALHLASNCKVFDGRTSTPLKAHRSAERNKENTMYNRRNASGEAAVEITCCGACDCATYPCVCPKDGCRCQATSRQNDASCTGFSNADLAKRIGRRR